MNGPKLDVCVGSAFPSCGHWRCLVTFFCQRHSLLVQENSLLSLPKIPCYVSQGILLEVFEYARNWRLCFADLGPKSENSLLISLLAGNWETETGSQRTASSANACGL